MDERDITDTATANGWILPPGWRLVNEVTRSSDEGDVYEPVAEFAHWWMAWCLRSLRLTVWLEDEYGHEVEWSELSYDHETNDPFGEPGFLRELVDEVLYEAQEAHEPGLITKG